MYNLKLLKEQDGEVLRDLNITLGKKKLAAMLGNLILEYGCPVELLVSHKGQGALEFYNIETYEITSVTYSLINPNVVVVPIITQPLVVKELMSRGIFNKEAV